MIKSMTGFGRVAEAVDGYEISFEIKSVNNRFADISIRLPRVYSYMEDELKRLIMAHVSRGKIDAFLSIERPTGSGATVMADEDLVASYLAAFRSLSEKFGLRNDATVETLTRLPDVFTKVSGQEDEDAMLSRVKQVAEKALASFDLSREREGSNLEKDIRARLNLIGGITQKIREASPLYMEQYRRRLEARITDLLGNVPMDEGRVLTEVAIMADKLDTQEEMTRLASHLNQFFTDLKSSAPVGRKLDFLLQEINREFNTTGSKCSMLEISKLVIEAKAELEKIREQIQNIE